MPLWGNSDDAANSDIAALIQVQSNTANSTERTRLYANVTPGAFMNNSNLIIGQFGIDSNEQMALVASGTAAPAHAGWVLRTEGTGLRAGRVTYETLVAMGSMSGDGSDDTYAPDYTIVITTQPSNITGNGNLTMSVVASTLPGGGALSYKWQQSYAGALSWADIPNTAGVWFNNTAITLTANATVANANTVRVVVSVPGGNTVFSSNATITFA